MSLLKALLCGREAGLPQAKYGTQIYYGIGAAKDVTGFGFDPDASWIKNLDQTDSNQLYDVVRGATNVMYSDLTAAEASLSGLSAFITDGFSLGTATANNNGIRYIARCLKAGNSTEANSDGSISSWVKAAKGFSIVSYTGTGAAGTIGHGLRDTPSAIIVKDRDSGSNHWVVFAGSSAWALFINLTNAATYGAGYWNNTLPNDSVFSVGTDVGVNTPGHRYIAYCFADTPNFFKCGSYDGNGSSTGPVIDCGFFPETVIIKHRSSAGNSWFMYDYVRDPTNPNSKYLLANTGGAEVDHASVHLEFLSNGFQPLTDNSGLNGASQSYTFIALAA